MGRPLLYLWGIARLFGETVFTECAVGIIAV